MKSTTISVAEIQDCAQFNINEALLRICEMLAEEVDEPTIRATMDYIPKAHWKPLMNRAKAIRKTVENSMPPELRQAWVRARLNELADNPDHDVALKAIGQISKDPELVLTAKTATVHIDMQTASRLEALSKERVVELKATDGITYERKP